MSGVSTARAISPDSGVHWADEGAWKVAEGIHRIPLPLPMDGLKAINVYVIETDDGLTLIDGGWAIPQARELLEACLGTLGAGFGDINRFMVTHVHRDHYTMARVLGSEFSVEVLLGAEEEPALRLLNNVEEMSENPFIAVMRTAGAEDIGKTWAEFTDEGDLPDPALWGYPDTWIPADRQFEVGRRTIDAIHTPGHTPGHYVFADQPAGLLFAGDHVLPTITPSIGFTVPPAEQPLVAFMNSLKRVRDLPDLQLLPAHGPVAPSTHARVDELLDHHENRLDQCATGLDDGGVTALQVATTLGWTRHLTAFKDLDIFAAGMACMETKAHLDMLCARGLAVVTSEREGDLYRPTPTG